MRQHEIIDILNRLLPAEFDELLLRTNVPTHYLPSNAAPQASRAVALIRYFDENPAPILQALWELGRLPVSPSKRGSWVRAMIAQPLSAVGKDVAGYRLTGFIGQGGSGVVFRARSRSSAGNVALKLTYPLNANFDGSFAERPSAEINRGLLASLQNDVHAVSSLSYDGIVSIHEHGTIVAEGDVSLYVVMDLVEGEPLLRWSARKSQEHTARTILTRAAAIALALHRAHTHRFVNLSGVEQIGVLHGDIKPANIMIASAEAAVIMDFMSLDLHKALDRAALAELRRPGGMLWRPATGCYGTHGFMSPEQEMGGIITVKTDVYSLGVTMACMFGASRDAWNCGIFWDRDAREQCVKPLRELLDAMMENDPNNRPNSMLEVAEALQRIDQQHILQRNAI